MNGFLSLHGVLAIELSLAMPSNSNCRTLRLTCEAPEGRTQEFKLALFGKTDALDALPRADDFKVAGGDGDFVATADDHARPTAPDALAQLRAAEAFIAGFEDDPLQEGVADLLAGIRAAIAKAEGRS